MGSRYFMGKVPSAGFAYKVGPAHKLESLHIKSNKILQNP